MPCGRVALAPGGLEPARGVGGDGLWFEAPADDGVAFHADAEFRAATARAARADASLVRAKLGHQGFGAVAGQLGIGALRRFLERHVERRYRANVARVVPLLRLARRRRGRGFRGDDSGVAGASVKPLSARSWTRTRS